MGALGAKAVGELALLAGAAGEGELADGLGGAEVWRDAELTGGMAQDAALQGWGEFGQGAEVKGDAFGSGAAAAAHGPAGQDELRREARDLRRPPGFFVAGKLGHLGEVLAQPRVPGLERGQELVANAVAGIGEVAVGGILAPGLAETAEVQFHFSTGDGQERTQNVALGELENGMDATEAFSPCAAQELGEDGFGLIVEGVGGGDGVEGDLGHQGAQPGVTQTACGFFDGFRGLAGARGGFGRGVKAGGVEGEAKLGSQIADESKVGVGFRAAQAVVQVRDVQREAQFPALVVKSSQQGNGICAAGDGHAEAQTGAEMGGVKRKRGSR